MDVCFELLLLNKQPLDSLECYQKTIVWEGIEYPQEPKCYIWGKYICLTESLMPKKIHSYLPISFAEKEWTYLSVTGQILDLLELEVNGSKINWGGKSLDSLLKLLLTPQNKWFIVFEWQCDQIDKTYYLSIDECISKLKNNLKYEKKREGFIIISAN
ncbi:hypothetical protein WKK05_12250 [Nostoc sp. UHCC 0302]|uniref:hypothetical protein n=1 Tax=Nostoc sp. UHCC 0302 TaxID=3134896 RepID=UPI00311C9E62